MVSLPGSVPSNGPTPKAMALGARVTHAPPITQTRHLRTLIQQLFNEDEGLGDMTSMPYFVFFNGEGTVGWV